MYPDFSGFSVYPAAIATGIIVGTLVNIASLRSDGFPAARVFLALMLFPVMAYAGAKAMSIVERASELEPLGQELVHGLRYPGGIIGLGLALVIAASTKLLPGPVSRLLDALTPGVPVAMVFVRMGCLLAGCCYGAYCTLPWAMSYPRASPAWGHHVRAGIIERDALWSAPVHPFPVLMVIVYGLLAVTVWKLRESWTGHGHLMAFCMIVIAISRLLLNPLRASLPSYLYVADAALFVVGIGLWLRANRTTASPIGAVAPEA